jgi:hypothetical protein
MVTSAIDCSIKTLSFIKASTYSLCFLMVATLAACGGGSSEPTSAASGIALATGTSNSFSAVQFHPVNGSADVAQNTPLTIDFSAEVDPASVTAETVTLAGPQGNIDGKATANGKQVVFTPTEGLNFSTQYTLQVNSGLRSKDGTSLSTAASTAFTLKQGSWSTPTAIDTAVTGNAQQLKTVKGFNGAVFAVWLANDGTRNNAWASRFDANQHIWSAPTLIEQTDLTIASIDVAVDGQGNAWAVWGQRNSAGDYSNGSVQAARYEVDTQAWSAPVVIVSDISVTTRIAADPAGNTWVMWEAGNNIFARYFDVAQQRWLSEVTLQSDNSGSGFVPTFALAMDEQGNSMTAWTNAATGIAFSLAQYSTANSRQWQPTNAFERQDSFENAPLLLSADAQGNFMVAWIWAGSMTPELRVSRYDKRTALWEPATTLAQAGTLRLHQAKLDRAGNAIVLWTQSRPADLATGAAPQMLYTTRFDVKAQTWAPPVTLDQNVGPNSFPPHDQADFDFDRCGNAVLIWRQFAGGSASSPEYNIMSSRYNISGNQFAPATSLKASVLQADQLAIVVPRHGKPIATWLQTENGQNRVFSALATSSAH